MTGVTPTRAIERPDSPEEDAARLAKSLAPRMAAIVAALRPIVPSASFEREFLRKDAETFDAVDRRLVERMAWHYRRQLPRHLAPRLNPDDPIVRQMEAA